MQPDHSPRTLSPGLTALALAILLLPTACSEDAPDDPPRGPAEALGLTLYLGTIAPAETATDGDETVWTFDPDDGPMCLRGAPFRASLRTTGHPDLVIFLQGGGACWSAFCLAVREAPAGVPTIDLLNPEIAENPVAEWNALYLPYCDGSLFVGDRDHDDSGDGQPDRFHRGLHNLSAALDAAARAQPEPRRILLAGASAGGYGTVLAALLVRHVWPDSELIVMNDSGAGIAMDGEPDFLLQLLDEFNATRFIPDECTGCLDDGHIVPLVAWTLDRIPDLRIGVFSGLQDSVLAGIFLDVPPEDYQHALLRETDAVHAAHPDRYRRFFIEGRMHTTLIGDPSGIIGTNLGAVELPPGIGTRLASISLGRLATTVDHEQRPISRWLQALIDNAEDWTDTVFRPED